MIVLHVCSLSCFHAPCRPSYNLYSNVYTCASPFSLAFFFNHSSQTFNRYSLWYFYRECYFGKVTLELFHSCSVTYGLLIHQSAIHCPTRNTLQQAHFFGGLRTWYVTTGVTVLLMKGLELKYWYDYDKKLTKSSVQ